MDANSPNPLAVFLQRLGEVSDLICSPLALKAIDTGKFVNLKSTEVPLAKVESDGLENRRRRQMYIRRLGIQDAPVNPVNPIKEDTSKPVESVSSGSFSSESASSESGAKAAVDIRMSGPDKFRINYLRKLSYSKVWVPQSQRPPRHQTLLIFDWDDTLLCTSFLNAHSKEPLPAVVNQHLRKIASQVKELLSVASQMGQVFIITNAMSGWVEYSAAMWMPELLPVLQTMHIISARSKYEPQYPDEVNQWKLNAFLDIQQQMNLEVVTNLLSMGDSEFEMDAVHAMGCAFSRPLIKTIKLKQSPTPEQLVKQLELVVPKFQTIVNTGRNLKIQCEKTTKK